MLRSLAIVGFLSLTSCAASREYFIPREDVRAQSPRGWPAAQYTVTIAGQSAGEAKVWSEGTMKADVDDQERTILHVGFEIENRSAGDLDFEVDHCRVVDVQGRGERFADLGAHAQSGVLHVTAGQVGLIDLEFVLPLGTRPRDLRSFRVDWRLTTPQGQFQQSTPFRVDTATYYRPYPYGYGYGYGYYDPWYPWWGFGTGFAVGRISSHLWWGPPHWHHR